MAAPGAFPGDAGQSDDPLDTKMINPDASPGVAWF